MIGSSLVSHKVGLDKGAPKTPSEQGFQGEKNLLGIISILNHLSMDIFTRGFGWRFMAPSERDSPVGRVWVSEIYHVLLGTHRIRAFAVRRQTEPMLAPSSYLSMTFW